MLTARRPPTRLTVLAAGAVVALGLTTWTAAPTHADGGWRRVTCGPLANRGRCRLQVGGPTGPGGPGRDPTQPVGGKGPGRTVICYIPISGPPPPPGAKAGGWFRNVCAPPRAGRWQPYPQPPVWIDGPTPGTPGAPVSPATLARTAERMLALPAPSIHLAPPSSAPQLVQTPIWAWIDPAAWRRATASAAVPGMSVTVTATPTALLWSWGDGVRTSCASPGRPYQAAATPPSASSGCGHVYHQASDPKRYPLIAHLLFHIAWAGGGSSGTLPNLATSDATALRVVESQALVGR